MSVESAELLRQENTKKIMQTMKKMLNENDSSELFLGEIARQAGVAVKTINNIFGTKKNLMIMTAISAYAEEHTMLEQLTASSEFAELSGLEQVMTLHYERAKFQSRYPYMIRSVSEIERLKLTNETEIRRCSQYLALVDSITSYYDAPIKKGHLDGSIKKNISEEEMHAILFFSFGAILQKLKIISLNTQMNQKIDLHTTLRIILEKTKEFLSTNS